MFFANTTSADPEETRNNFIFQDDNNVICYACARRYKDKDDNERPQRNCGTIRALDKQRRNLAPCSEVQRADNEREKRGGRTHFFLFISSLPRLSSSTIWYCSHQSQCHLDLGVRLIDEPQPHVEALSLTITNELWAISSLKSNTELRKYSKEM